LKTAFVCEPIGRRYIRTLVTRLKFELGTAIGILVADIGLVGLWVGGFASLRLSLILLLLSLTVAIYLGLCEAPASHRLLGKARSVMLDEIRVVKSDSSES
jgi:ABC-type proline/glycine betaine transport system permease subunit